MTLQEWLCKFGACGSARRWVGDKTLQEAWATCHRGDWMRWLSVAACGNTSWTTRDHEKMVSAWDRIEREHRLEDAMYRAFNEARLTFGAGSPQENAVWQRYSSLQCDVFRSVQPTPPPIEGVS